VGIEFKDPHTGIAYDDSTVPPAFYIVFADAYLKEPLPVGIPRDKLSAHLDDFLLLVPLYDEKGPSPEAIPVLYWRIGYMLPASRQRPPQNPPLEYLQQMMDARNPWDTKITILSVVSSSSYRVRAAVASTYFRKVGAGNILLAGDAAHVVSPVGGQGMNLGICDAVAVAHAVRGHHDTISDVPDPKHPERDDVLLHYASSRRIIGVRVAGLTRGLTTLLNAGSGWRRIFRNFVLRAVSYLPFANRFAARRISGLENRDV
jgi:2-polyprenyl-6-methoxyphenol hydroxylase-like FAD-dependent oxidoreductase